MSKLLALDQSSRCSGFAVFDDGDLIDSGTFTFTDEDLGVRLTKIRDQVQKLIDKYKINEVVIEDIQLQATNGKTMNVTIYKALAEVMGVIVELFTEQSMKYTIIPSVVWKSELSIKGKARAEQKKNAQAYVINTYNKKVSQDESDAICIGTAHLKKEKMAYSWD